MWKLPRQMLKNGLPIKKDSYFGKNALMLNQHAGKATEQAA